MTLDIVDISAIRTIMEDLEVLREGSGLPVVPAGPIPLAHYGDDTMIVGELLLDGEGNYVFKPKGAK